MSEARTAEEARSDCVGAMGEQLGSVYHALWQEVAWLHMRWDQYVALYGTKSSRVGLLNEAAPAFFRIVQDTLWEDTILHVARLTDPVKSAGKPNLTIQGLQSLVSDDKLRQEIKDATGLAVSASQFCRDWRNRHLAHRDLDLALKHAAQPLAEATREKVRSALKAIVDVLNVVSAYYQDSTSAFGHGSQIGGAFDLLLAVRDGLRWQKEKEARFERRDFRPGDFANDDL
jgi:hypothetical protein